MVADEGDYERQMEKRRYDFKRALEEIRDIHGRGTELVSVYVPPDKQISDVANYLRGELSQSQNIKSKRTQKAVSGAIESILARLKYFKTPPPNGVIFFIGEAPTSGDQQNRYSLYWNLQNRLPLLCTDVIQSSILKSFGTCLMIKKHLVFSL